jgi:hypothetical protein
MPKLCLGIAPDNFSFHGFFKPFLLLRLSPHYFQTTRKHAVMDGIGNLDMCPENIGQSVPFVVFPINKAGDSDLHGFFNEVDSTLIEDIEVAVERRSGACLLEFLDLFGRIK